VGSGKKEEGMESIVTKSCGVWIKKQKEVIELLSEAYGDEQKLQNLVAELDAREYRKPANTIERFLPRLLSYTAFQNKHWKRIQTTNLLERVHRELKRRTRVAGVFSNDKSLLQLIGSILMGVNEEWATGRRYLSMDTE